MRKLLYLLLIFEFVILINCKGGGGRGGGGRGGGGRGGGGHGGGGSGRGGPISDFVLYGIFLPIGMVCCCGCLCLCIRREKGEPSQSNQTFVTSNSKDVEQAGEEVYLSNAFQSGTWSCRYYQYDAWHGPHLFSLYFNKVDMTINGSGTDDVGTFTVDGIYSESTQRIGLTEHYQPGTGDLSQNLGHDVIIQVIYNTRCNQFEGKWYVQTQKYNGENQIELKFVGSQELQKDAVFGIHLDV